MCVILFLQNLFLIEPICMGKAGSVVMAPVHAQLSFQTCLKAFTSELFFSSQLLASDLYSH